LSNAERTGALDVAKRREGHRCAWLAALKHVRTKLPLISHDIQDKNLLLILTIKNATRWNHYFPVYRIREFWGYSSGFGKIFQSVGFIENLFYQAACSGGIIQSNILCDFVSLLKRRISPDYFSHLLIFSLASLWLYVLPSNTA